MQVLLKGQVKDLQVTSVILAKDKEDKEGLKLKMFFCPNCQNPLLQYRGCIVWILPGPMPIELPVFIKCSNSHCGKVYCVSSVV
jgi:RNase P subunit RPR2